MVAAPSIVGSPVTSTANSGTTLVVSLPSSPTVGNLQVVYATWFATAPATPTGWQRHVLTALTSSYRCAFYTRVIRSGDPSSVTLTGFADASVDGPRAAIAWEVGDWGGFGPAVEQFASNPSPYSAASVTTQLDNSLVFSAGGTAMTTANAASTLTWSGGTSAGSAQSAAAVGYHTYATAVTDVQATAGATTARTMTPSGSWTEAVATATFAIHPRPGIVASASAALSASRSPSVTFTGWQPVEGQVVALFPSSTDTATITIPSGWVNPLGGTTDVESDSHQACAVYHVVTSGEESAGTLTYTATNLYDATETGNVVGVVLHGVDAGNVVDSTNTGFDSGNSVTPHILPGLTGSNLSNDSIVLQAVIKDGTGTYTTPSGVALVASSNTNQGKALYVRSAYTVAGTNIAATNVTPSAGDEYIAITLALSRSVTTRTGTGTGTYTWAGGAAGAKTPRGTASGTYTWAATAQGKKAQKGTAAGTYTWAATAVGGAPPNRGTTSGTYTWAGSATGSAPTVSAKTGTGSGTYTWAATAVGEETTTAATPTVVGYATGAAASGNSITFNKTDLPTLLDGDYLVAFLRCSTSSASADYACTGFARLGPTFPTIDAGGRLIGAYGHVVAAASEPATYTFTFTGTGGRNAGILLLVRGVDTAAPVSGFSPNTPTYYSATTWTTSENSLILSAAANEVVSPNSSTPTVVDSDYTTVATHPHTTGTAVTRTVVWVGSATATSTTAPSAQSTVWASSSSLAYWAISLQGLPVAVEPIPGFPSVASIFAEPGATMAHRGASGVPGMPEMSERGYDYAVGQGFGILEFSANRTSDGVWVGCHDADLDRTSETPTADISAMTWATVQTYENSLNDGGTPVPYYRLVDFLDKYTPTHVCFVDPKFGVGWITDLLDTLDAHGGPTKIVVKYFGVGSGSNALADAATLRGYQTWGYYYAADYSDGDLAANQSHWSILGMEFNASAPAWAAALSYGKPVVGHIAASQANYDTAVGNGAVIVQCSRPDLIAAVGFTGTLAGLASSSYAWAGSATGDTPPNKGSGSGAYTWAGTAQGKRAPRGAASGTYTWAGSATGRRTPKGTVSAGYTWASVASGVRPTVGQKSGTASGFYTWSGAASGKRDTRGTGTGGYGWSGAASGRRESRGTAATGTHTWSATATGKRNPGGAATDGYGWASGLTTGAKAPRGPASGQYGWAGSAFGGLQPNGAASGTYTWVGSTTGKRGPQGTASSAYGWSASTTGKRAPISTATGGYVWSSAAIGNRPEEDVQQGHATGIYGWSSTAAGAKQSRGANAGAYGWDGSAIGWHVSRGTAAGGTYTFIGTAAGQRPSEMFHSGTAAGAYGWGSTIIGASGQHGDASGGEYGWRGRAFGQLTAFDSQRTLRVKAHDRGLRVPTSPRTLLVARRA